jgi:hypothetical protein
MRLLVVSAGLIMFGVSSGLAQVPAPDRTTQPNPPAQNVPAGPLGSGDGQPSESGEGPGTIYLVPRSMGMPPGAVMLVPNPEAAQRAGQDTGGQNQAGPRRLGGDGVRPRGGTVLRLRRGNDEVEVRCGFAEPTQSCLQIVGPLVERFFAVPAPSLPENGTAQRQPPATFDPAPSR